MCQCDSVVVFYTYLGTGWFWKQI